MTTSRDVLASSLDICRGQISWDYDRAEIIADGVVHVIGVCLGLIGAVTIVVIAIKMERIDVAPIVVYVIGLVTMLAFSAAYNMWPVSPAKWVLRRFDHSAIYLLIAGTYTPFLMQMKNVLASASLGIGVWLSAGIGMALKLALPGRFDRLAVVLCLLLGWSGVMAYDSLASVLPSSSLWLLAIGGILYPQVLCRRYKSVVFRAKSTLALCNRGAAGSQLCCSSSTPTIRRTSCRRGPNSIAPTVFISIKPAAMTSMW